MATNLKVENERGSVWHRWDPHIHTPGTALNNHFGAAGWQGFLDSIKSSTPAIRVLGVTDYLSIENYIELKQRMEQGDLPSIGMIFPNVEMRFSIETSKGPGINVHLLFSPEDPDHVSRIKSILRSFTFRSPNDLYHCDQADLIRLGRAQDPNLVDDAAAMKEGVNQFKLSFEQLRDAWDGNPWMRENCLVAVAGGEKDGTSGLRDDTSSFAQFRKSIEAFAHIIFTANPQQIAFFLGQGAATLEDLEKKWHGRKPCLHGSDAHSQAQIGVPAKQRYCWLKGDLTFETLRQACVDPESRVFIGVEPPRGALPGNVISAVSIKNADWFVPENVPLNSGLVAIIGPRGSGKTALADLIAMGASAVSPGNASFLKRARDHLEDKAVTLEWSEDHTTTGDVGILEADDDLWDREHPHVQYLSQQFVDQLCSADSLDDELVREIQRVVFNSHPETNRMGATDFNELLELLLAGAHDLRQRKNEALHTASKHITDERVRKDSLPTLIKDRDAKKQLIETDTKDRMALIGKGQEARVKRHETIAAAVDRKRLDVAALKRRGKALQLLQEDLKDCRERRFPDIVSGLEIDRADTGFSDDEWKLFAIAFVHDVDQVVSAKIKQARADLQRITGPALTDPPVDENADPSAALIAEPNDLASESLHLLERELARLAKLIGNDVQNARRFAQLSEKLGKTEAALAKVEADIAKAQTANERIKALRNTRDDAYSGVFTAILAEEEELTKLYAPLKQRLEGAVGSLSKLAFSVRRQVDLDSWAAQGENLLDLRKSGPFKGSGALNKTAKESLLRPWQRGTAKEAAAALAEFVRQNEEAIRVHQPDGVNYRKWAGEISEWLFSTDHISVTYGLQYDGVDLEQLSQGTRGIVLLLLYLALDSDDDRPLVIDQPEENLDPQSVFDELVDRFRKARLRRQIIIVTHNANLVVNTDADQVVVASCGPHRQNQLPVMSYRAGGLENPAIRKAVCEILEGGERAFKERAKRLRMSLT